LKFNLFYFIILKYKKVNVMIVVLDCENNIPILKRVKKKEIKTDKTDDNILIEGDNYHAVTCLNYTHKEKIDVIYIDPPYNTGNKDFVYNDRYIDENDGYKHSKWLNFMDKRLRLAENLLKKDGSLFCSIDDNEYPRLILLLEKIFGEKNIKTICVKMSEATGVKMASVIKNGRIPKLKEYLVIAKKSGIKNLYLEKLPKEKWDEGYKTIILNTTEEEIRTIKKIRDNENRNNEDLKFCDKIISKWKYSSILDYFKEKKISKKELEEFKYKNAWRVVQIATLTGGSRTIAKEKKDKFNNLPSFFCITTPQKKMYLIKGTFNHETKLPRCKVLFADDYLTIHPGDFWTDIKTTGLDNEGGVSFKNGKKPLKLMDKIIKTNSSKNITILDFFAGSGTTGQAVLELNKRDNGNRKFILCTYNEENGTQVKIAEKFCYPRIKNSILGYNKKDGLNGNLQYFKTDLIPVKKINKITDNQKRKLAHNAGEMIAIKENTFEEIEINEWYQIFENKDKSRKTAIYFRENLDQFKNLINKIGNTKTILYIFSYGEEIDENIFLVDENITLEAIPEPIIKLYKKINLTFKK